MADTYSSDRRGEVDASAPKFGGNGLLAIGIVVAALFFGRDVFVPFVLAVLLSFVLAVPVRILQGFGLGRVFPVVSVVTLAFLALLTLGGVVTAQLAQLAGDLPSYQTTIRTKISGLREAASGKGPLENAARMLQSLSDELGLEERKPPPPARGKPPAAEADGPIPVVIAGTQATPLERIAGFVTPVLHPLATIGLVIVFVVFILLQRNDLRNRLIRLAGSHDLQRTTAAMNDAARRLSRFFLTQVLLNACFGIVVGLGLWALGLPSPILWGILAAISRFIPYVGVVLAAGGPLILAASVDPHWSLLAWTAGFFMVIEFCVGQMVEPLLYGHSTGLSPIAVITSVTFWTLLWGPVGLVLATPLTVCLVVLGRHVEALEFLDVMFGDRPPLTPAESFYQRMLAGDAGEAVEQAERLLKEHRLATYYDEVAVKGLALAQLDLSRGALDERRLARVDATVAEVLEDLVDHEEATSPAGKSDAGASAGDPNQQDWERDLSEADLRSADLASLAVRPDDGIGAGPGRVAPVPVVCIAARNALDRGAAEMLAQLLARAGLPAESLAPDTLTPPGLARLAERAPRIVCLSYLDVSSPVHVRYAVRRIRRRLPDATIVVCSWGAPDAAAKELCESSRSDRCASRLADATRICLEVSAAQHPVGRPAEAARDAAPAEAPPAVAA